MMGRVPVGHRLEVEVPYGGRAIACEATVVRAAGAHLGVSPPVRHRVKVPIQTDQLVAAIPMSDALYRVQCRVLGANDEELTLEMLGKEGTQRIQRRRFLRVRTGHPCTLRPETLACKENQRPVQGELVNLGGGGCAIRAAEAPSAGTRITLRCSLLTEPLQPLHGLVLRSRQLGEQRLLAVEFVGLSEADQRELVRIVYALQLRWAKQEESRPPEQPGS